MRKYLLLIAALNYTILVVAQVHVRNEPRHHNVFENEFVRILDVHLGPGDTTLYHLHNTPSVFIIFTNTNVGSQLIGKQPQKKGPMLQVRFRTTVLIYHVLIVYGMRTLRGFM